MEILGRLCRELSEHPHTVQEYASIAGPRVITALAELNRAFSISRNDPQSAHASARSPGEITLPSRDDLDSGHDESRPILPRIADTALEAAVFTHPGMNSHPKTSYDRLEILGDAYIELIATNFLWHKFPDISAGRISQIRERLVKNETLSGFSTMYGFDERASVPSDYLSQPRRWTKTKGDIFEAYVAAVILSNPTSGYRLVEDWLRQLWTPMLLDVGDIETLPRAKETLAKKLMGKGVKLKYIDERVPEKLEGGMQRFFIGVYLTGWGWDNRHLGSGQGPSKTIAGNQAAMKALQNTTLIAEIAAVREAYNKPNG